MISPTLLSLGSINQIDLSDPTFNAKGRPVGADVILNALMNVPEVVMRLM